MISLRKYQEQCLQKIWAEMFISSDQLNKLPTGAGKTIIFVELVRRAMEKFPELRAGILVNKIKLAEQTREKLEYLIESERIGVFCGSLGEYQDKNSVTVASIQSIGRHTPFFHLLIIDEAHNAENSATYQNFINRVKGFNPRIKIVRFTATPFTSESGYLYGEDKEIKKLTFDISLNEMIKLGFLVPPVFKSSKVSFDTSKLRTRRGEYVLKDLEKLTSDERKVRSQVEDALPRLNGRKKIIWAATCIEHAMILKNAIEHFEECSVVHSEMSMKDRVRHLDNFEKGNVRHLISIMIVSEGYDFPPIDGVVIMRPTRSPVLYVQLVGRGLRISPGKEDCLVLDYGNVVEYMGHPNDPFVDDGKNKSKKNEKKAIICPGCETINFLPVKACRSCGYEFFQAEKDEIDRTKNLTRQAAEVNLNSKGRPEFEVPVLAWTVNENYISKNGNACYEITYSTTEGAIREFLKKGSVHQRIFTAQYHQFKKEKPLRILVEKEGKYFNVKKRIFK